MTKNIREHFIVTADDYGIRQTAEPILRLVHEGKIDRVAVLIHYVSVDQAKALLATGVKIDLHLELIGLLKSGEKVRESPLFRGINFFMRYVTGLLTAKKVEAEWRDQILRFQELFGRLPDGLNSHEHLHFFPAFAQVFIALAQEYRVVYIRFSRRGMLMGQDFILIGKILTMLWHRTWQLYAGQPFQTSDYLVSLDWLSDFQAFSRTLPSGTVELVVHLEREEDYRIMLEHF
ncbi:MAG: ChbG/HpnK family deacetylase [Candidatus Moranbacteria bacterium]|nr:ChbG/HpnK family deacetylase [Candidatus Moranbacteria bacterium]